MLRQQLLRVCGGFDVCAFKHRHHAAVHQETRLAGVAQDVHAGGLRSDRNAGEIHVRGDVFLAHQQQRVAVGLVLVVAHQSAHVALRVVVLGLGKTVVDKEGRAALQAFAQGGDKGFGLGVDFGDAVGREGRVSRRPKSRRFLICRTVRPHEFFIGPGHAHFSPREAVKVQQLDRHGVQHFVAHHHALHRVGQ